MDIVIVGDGKVGATLTEMLSGEGHSLTIIDQNPAVLKRQTERLDIIGVLGNGASYQAQQEAGVPEADLFIAATSTDEVNMVCCLLAKKLGCPNTIARIRNPEYNEQLRLMREDLGLSLVINPELSAAREIASLLSFPHADSIGSLSGGRVQIVRYTLEEKGMLTGRRLSEVSQKRGQNVVVCAVERGGEVSIPKGDFRLAAGDHIYLAGKLSNIDNFLRAYGERNYAIRNAMVIGGGKITHYLAKMLEGSSTKLKILENDPQRCRTLAEKLPHALVVEADGSDRAVLDEEGIAETDALIALTNMDEENLIISMYGILQNVPKIITKINRTGYMDIVEKIGLDSLISPKYAAADQIAQYVRALQNSEGSPVDTLYKIVGGKAEALEFTVSGEAEHLEQPLRSLPIAPDVLLAAIVRDGEFISPTGQDQIHQGDRVVVVTTKANFDDFNDIFE